MDFITEFLEGVQAWVTGFWDIVISTLESAVGIFYNTDGFTLIGYLTMFGLAVGLVTLGMGYVRSLVKK